MNKKNKKSWMLSAIAISMFCAIFFSVSCYSKIIVVPAGVDILGFVDNGQIVSKTPIVRGVIVTEGFILDYKRMKNLIKDKGFDMGDFSNLIMISKPVKDKGLE